MLLKILSTQRKTNCRFAINPSTKRTLCIMISQYKLKGEKLQVRRYFNTFPGYAIAQDRVRVKLRPHLRCFPQAVPTRHRAEKQFQYVLKKENLKKTCALHAPVHARAGADSSHSRRRSEARTEENNLKTFASATESNIFISITGLP